MKTIEIIASGIEDINALQHTDIHRIELITGFSEGGVTPSHGLIHLAAKKSMIPIMVMIRPRGGHFVYTPYEIDQMIHDIAYVKQQKLQGVVLGALTPTQEIDQMSLEKLLKHCDGLEVTFHRAFSALKDPFKGLEILTQLGVHRILTGGMEPDYQTGVQQLKKLLTLANDRIVIMPGGGFREDNIKPFLKDVPEVQEIHIGTGVRVNHDCLEPISSIKLKNMIAMSAEPWKSHLSID